MSRIIKSLKGAVRHARGDKSAASLATVEVPRVRSLSQIVDAAEGIKGFSSLWVTEAEVRHHLSLRVCWEHNRNSDARGPFFIFYGVVTRVEEEYADTANDG